MNRKEKFFLISLCAMMFCTEIFSVWDKFLTVDEGAHMHYGLRILRGDSSRFDDSKMPVTALNALPTVFAEFLKENFFGEKLSPVFFYYGFAKIPTMLFSIFVLLILYFWTKKLYGWRSAIFAGFFFALCPNVIAHSRLITNDIYAMGGVLFSIFSLQSYFQRRSFRNLLLLSLSVAFAIISKFTCVFLYPLIVLIFFLRYGRLLGRFFLRNSHLSSTKFAKFLLFHLAIFAISNLFLINSAYFFNGTFRQLSSYQFRSDDFKALARIPFLSSLPIPLPSPMLEGMDWVNHNQRTGETFGNIYALGMTAPKGDGFKFYYLVVWFFKIPIPIQLFFYIALFFYLKGKYSCLLSLSRDRDFLFLLLPSMYFFILLSFYLKAQLGVRYFLICMPFILIFTAGHVNAILNSSKVGRALFLIGIAWLLTSTMSYYPHFISYFNEFSYDRKNNWKILADSNLDWGENFGYLQKYARENPDIIYNPDNPCSGHIVVDANKLAGVTAHPEKYKWLREINAKSHIAYSYIVYHIKQ